VRVAFVIPDCGEGGLFQFYNSLIPVLARHADVHCIFANPFGSPLTPQIAGATCHVLSPETATPIVASLSQGPLAVAPNLVRGLSAAYQAWNFTKRLEPDCVELCDWPLAAVPGVLDGSLPVVVQAHGSMGQIAEYDQADGQKVETALVQLIESQVLGLAHRVQSSSRANAAWWQATARREVAVIRPAFPLGDGVAQRVGAISGRRLSTFGRLQAWKGPHVLCEALELLGDHAPSCDWFGAAKPWSGGKLSTTAHLAQSFPVVWNQHFHFHGPIGHDEVSARMAASHAIIVPSTWDVFNFTVVEAMAAGRPVIVSNGAGAAELIEHGENGFIFSAGDAAALAAVIAQANALSTSAAQAMGTAAHATVADHLDPARIAAERMAAYAEAVASHATAPPQPAPDWLKALLTPAPTANWRIQDFFGTLPARPMVSALVERLATKLPLVRASA